MSRSAVALVIATLAFAAGGVTAASAQVAASAVPAQCRTMNTSPYSAPERLEVASAKGVRVFSVEIAADYGTRAQGMMCRTRLGESEGMLFQFADAQERSFWMNNTLIPLDIIYIAPNGRIVSIRKNARPLDRTPLSSGGAASGVLEVRGGLSDKLGLKPGDKVIHPFFQ